MKGYRTPFWFGTKGVLSIKKGEGSVYQAQDTQISRGKEGVIVGKNAYLGTVDHITSQKRKRDNLKLATKHATKAVNTIHSPQE